MPDNAITPYVFLDTEVFRAHQLDFESPNIRRLMRLAVDGPVKILLTTVTKGEVMDDLADKARESLKQLKEIRRLSRTMRKILPGDAVDAIEAVKRDKASKTLCNEFDNFIAKTGTAVLNVDRVSPVAIFNNYFNGEPPFGGVNKKAEFPDAFACGALGAWSVENNNTNIYVVSNDNDWKKMCGLNPALISVARLDELLQLFTDSEIGNEIKRGLEGKQKELKQLIRDKADSLDFYVGDQLVDGEIDSMEIDDVEIDEFHIVEIKDGEASVSVFCNVTVQASVVADDADSGIYDDETRSMFYVFRLNGVITRELEMMVEAAITYNKEKPEQITITSVEFEEKSVELDVDENELMREDEYLDDEFDPQIDECDQQEPPNG